VRKRPARGRSILPEMKQSEHIGPGLAPKKKRGGKNDVKTGRKKERFSDWRVLAQDRKKTGERNVR